MIQVQTGSFILRLLSFSEDGILPKDLTAKLETETPNFYKWAKAVVVEKSVNFIYDAEAVAEGTKKKLASIDPNSRWAKKE